PVPSRRLAGRYLQAGTLVVSAPLQIWSLVAYQPAVITLSRVSAMIGVGWRMIDLTTLPPGVVKSVGLLPATGATDASTLMVILVGSLSLHRATAAWPAALPSSLLFFQMSTNCLPSATLLRFAGSPSWPLTGGYGSYDLPLRAAATPRAVLSFSASTASIFWPAALAWSMIASMLAWAFSVFQASV